jgi:hypothetical protein
MDPHLGENHPLASVLGALNDYPHWDESWSSPSPDWSAYFQAIREYRLRVNELESE